MVEKLETERLDVEEAKPPRRTNPNLCVVCGEECPEGKQVCYICEHDGFAEARFKQKVRQAKYPRGLCGWYTVTTPRKRK